MNLSARGASHGVMNRSTGIDDAFALDRVRVGIARTRMAGDDGGSAYRISEVAATLVTERGFCG